MITKTIALSYHRMKELYADLGDNHQSACFISIIEEPWAPIFPWQDRRAITLMFHDVDRSALQRLSAFELKQYTLFSDKDAERIIDFVVDNHQQANARTLYVNCMAGISRSGAVTTFVCQVLALDRAQFAADNPQICPNDFVLEGLYRCWADRRSALLKQ